MSKTQNPAIGRASGKMANVILSKNFNQNVMRSKPLEVSDAKTATQLIQRSKFKAVTDLCSTIVNVLDLGFRGYKGKLSPYAYAIKENKDNTFVAIDGNTYPDPTKFVISKGLVSYPWDLYLGMADIHVIYGGLSCFGDDRIDDFDFVNCIVVSETGVFKAASVKEYRRFDATWGCSAQGIPFESTDWALVFLTRESEKTGNLCSGDTYRFLLDTAW